MGRGGRRKLAVAVILLAGLGAWFGVSRWSYHHPAAFHDCRMLAALCPSGDAVWVPNGYSVPLYGKCACAATLRVGVGTR